MIQSMYSHKTVIVALASADPMLFCTLHMYTSPLSPLIRFLRVRVSDEESTVLLPCLVQAMLGSGLPVALQNRVTPSLSTTSSDNGLVANSGGSRKKSQSTCT